MVRERSATACPSRDHDFAAETSQQPDCRVIDMRVQRALRAACQYRDAFLLRTFCREHLRVVVSAHRRDCFRRKFKHGFQPPVRHYASERPRGLRQQHGYAEAGRIWKHLCENPAQSGIADWAPVGSFDVLSRVIDQLHVFDAGWACRHACEAGQASVDMANRAAVRRAAVFEHFLDQVDPSPRTVEFIANQLVGWAGRIAHSAMNARPDDLVGASDFRDCQLVCSELRLHALAVHQSGVENAARIEHFLQCRRDLFRLS